MSLPEEWVDLREGEGPPNMRRIDADAGDVVSTPPRPPSALSPPSLCGLFLGCTRVGPELTGEWELQVIFTEALTHSTLPWTAPGSRRTLFCEGTARTLSASAVLRLTG